MRNMCLGITAFVVSVGMVSVGAQGRNFSGTWVIDSERTMAAMQAAGESGGGAVVARSGAGGGAIGVMSAGGGGMAVARSGGSGGGVVSGGGGGAVGVMSAGGGGARSGVVVSSDTVITIDANSFSTDIGGVHTAYPLNGTEIPVQVRGAEGKARASWKGDTLVIETTVDGPNGPMVSKTSWSLDGDALVRETTRKTYYKRK